LQDASTNTLFGVAQGSSGLILRRLDVGTGKWTSTPIKSDFTSIGGNEGTVRAYDANAGLLYVAQSSFWADVAALSLLVVKRVVNVWYDPFLVYFYYLPLCVYCTSN
jgi:hypothetical protein